MRRIPMMLVGATIMPVMFVVLFRYVFAGAINVGNGMSYVNFLMAGIFVQSLAFSAPHTGITLAQDLQKGLIDFTVVQKPYQFGYLSVEFLAKAKREGVGKARQEMKVPANGIVDTGVEIVTPQNYPAFKKRLDALGVTSS